MVKERLEKNNAYSVEEHKRQVKQELQEHDYDDETIEEWLVFID